MTEALNVVESGGGSGSGNWYLGGSGPPQWRRSEEEEEEGWRLTVVWVVGVRVSERECDEGDSVQS